MGDVLLVHPFDALLIGLPLHLPLVLHNGIVDLGEHHRPGENSILAGVGGRLPGHRQLGNLTTGKAVQLGGNLRASFAVVEDVQLQPAKVVVVVVAREE